MECGIVIKHIYSTLQVGCTGTGPRTLQEDPTLFCIIEWCVTWSGVRAGHNQSKMEAVLDPTLCVRLKGPTQRFSSLPQQKASIDSSSPFPQEELWQPQWGHWVQSRHFGIVAPLKVWLGYENAAHMYTFFPNTWVHPVWCKYSIPLNKKISAITAHHYTPLPQTPLFNVPNSSLYMDDCLQNVRTY